MNPYTSPDFQPGGKYSFFSAGMKPSAFTPTPAGNIKAPVAPVVTPTVAPVVPPPSTQGSFNGVVIKPGSYEDTVAQMNTIKGQGDTTTGTLDSSVNTGSLMAGTGSFSSTGATDTAYKVPTTDVPSTAVGATSNYQDVIAKRQQYEDQYAQALANSANVAGQEKQNVINAKFSGDTTDFGAGAGYLQGLKSDIRTQTAAMLAQAAGTMVGVSQQDVTNALASVPNLQNVQQTADGSVIGFMRDPQTGKVVSQNFGNPLTGTFGAPTTGGTTIQSSPDGTVGSMNNQISLPQNPDGTYRTPDGGNVSSDYAQKIASLSPQYQNYVRSGPEGVAYIDSTKLSALPSGVQYQIQKEAAAAGIPWLDQSASAGLQSVDSLYSTLGLMQDLVSSTLSSGTGGHLKDMAKSKINDIFQNDPKLQNFENLRTLAGQADTNLMGGIGSGFRQNTANLGLSIKNLPVASDSLETANVKIQATRALLDQSMLKTFPAFKGTGSITSSGTAGSSSGTTYTGNYAQTKLGAIPIDF